MESFYYLVDGEAHRGTGEQYLRAFEMESLGIVGCVIPVGVEG